ncbi:carbohydrate ABC transporter permease [Isoptericola cucumis]|uniref:Sugar ABC transporter permease n=1 Tax=Isoptericola cucumis TaxID=1776856 RepID=A0ABQ2B797_9MICO|nr:carbohydrate ABC transporter permease [Isoptericola cucumis]GGI07046.1 sugar ABC transporter permease [Isoptericola cucumis]
MSAATSTAAEAATPQVRPRRASDQRGDRTVAGVSHTVLVIWCILVIAPMIWVFIGSFKTSEEIFGSPFSLPAEWGWTNYVSAWTDAEIGRAFFNTIIVVGTSLVLVMMFGAMCAYVLGRFEFPGRRAIYYLMLAGLTFPVFLAIVPLFFVLDNIGMLGTLPGLIITYVSFALPFTVFFLYAFFRGLPGDIAEAAAIDGAGHWRTFFQVMLPMARPGMASVAIFNFLGLWNQFLLPVALNPNSDNWVLSQRLAAFVSSAGYAVDFGAMFAAVVITIVPVLIAYLVFQRQLQGSVSAGTMK